MLCAALSILAVLYVHGERRRSLLLLEYTVERTANALLESYRAGFTVGEDVAEDIVGFGIYDPNGTPVVVTGSAPSSISRDRKPELEPVFELDASASTMSMIRPIGMMSLISGMGGMMQRRAGRPTHLFLSVSAGRFVVRRALYSTAYVVAPLFFAAVAYLIGKLHYRNWTYRRKIELQRNLVHLGEAARTLSHEIKNPLSAIQIQAGILRRVLPNERKDDLRIIEQEVARMRNLVERIGDFLKNPTGEPELIDIDELVADLAGRYSWDIELDGEPGRHYTRFDRDRLRSVFENLIRNAFEASETDAPVAVQIDTQRGSVHVSILDHGRGLPAGHNDRVFDPFFTTKETGSGIGLAISKRFVEAAGGELTLRPRKGGGTEALVTLTAARPNYGEQQ